MIQNNLPSGKRILAWAVVAAIALIYIGAFIF